ncbi:type II toxin-antitoxin system VapC family toxin [Allokutzneria sp. NRRL B-24872]|uniref:type II toxin-antitoxin system VapC family toxin n=1 Tax=Allokutzneria sp. NRRL B-24872 TaxID=1137961 RepID=UPI000A3841F2|nr:type II toxin-antitoxin system VapC family toxin [Allokutzneria sp. NRRL B-24872]
MIYLDACALIKLVLVEDGSVALAEHLQVFTEPLATSELSEVEIHRALIRLEADEDQHMLADQILAGFIRFPLGVIVAEARRLPGQHLRSLDALHLATAIELAQPLTEFITYDKRLAEHARAAGLPVASPR